MHLPEELLALPGLPERTTRLNDRLATAGVPLAAAPKDAWLQLFAAEGKRATVIDLYVLAAAGRGLGATDLTAAERLVLARSVMPVVWPGFEVERGSERTGDTLAVVVYDGTWPQHFAEWRRRILAEMGDGAAHVEHVGSTSVPGLPAKPIVDIQLSVADLSAEDTYIQQLGAVSLRLRSRDEEHRYLRPVAGLPRDVHVHVCGVGSEWERVHVLFRDYLRAHPAARKAYAATKLEGVRHWSDDGWGYTDYKTEIILDIMEAAEGWDAAGRLHAPMTVHGGSPRPRVPRLQHELAVREGEAEEIRRL